MKLLAVGCTAAIIAAILANYALPVRHGCPTGEAQGFVAIRTDPPHLVGTIPSRFTGDKGYFDRRYNCRGQSAQARRVDEGLYEIRFPGLNPKLALVTATSDEGVAASASPDWDGIIHVALRGPITGSNNGVALRRDVPFVVVVF